tara:strand:+ start:230 stop:340 length:111 start_codon:yes stop_codon:yes gene_type:complete
MVKMVSEEEPRKNKTQIINRYYSAADEELLINKIYK